MGNEISPDCPEETIFFKLDITTPPLKYESKGGVKLYYQNRLFISETKAINLIDILPQ